VDRRPTRLEPLAVGTAGDVGIERGIVRHHHHAVARDADIELQRRHTQGERALERRQRVLGREPTGAAMPLEVERGTGAPGKEQGGNANRGEEWAHGKNGV
jgi:hypothetical protein